MSEPQSHNYRFVIVGTSGAGKTTFAKELSRLLQIPHIELDALFWEPNWAETPLEIFQNRVQEALKAESWIVDGNYSKVRSFVWSKATTLVWLDYPLRVVFGRALIRTIKRAITREELWSGNRESTLRSFFSKKSILIWILQTYHRRRAEYSQFSKLPECQHLEIVRLTSQDDANRYLAKIISQLPRKDQSYGV